MVASFYETAAYLPLLTPSVRIKLISGMRLKWYLVQINAIAGASQLPPMHDKWKLQRAIGRAKTIVKAASGWKLELQSGLNLGLHWIRYSKGQDRKEEATLNPRKTAKSRYPQNLQCSRTYLLGPYDTTGRA